jgi:hypothetical protein
MRVDPRGGGIESMLSLFLTPLLDGELDEWCNVLCGDPLLVWAAGALRTMFRLEEAFLMGRRGEVRRGSEEPDGNVFRSASGSW